VTTFFQELWRVGLYKRSQGRITRQVTFFALAVTVFLGLWRLHETLGGAYGDQQYGPYLSWLLPGLLVVIGWWICYRVVNIPAFADFLIAVEAEMAKVSWPGRTELVRASIVVLMTILLMGFILFGFDWLWIILFTKVLHLLPESTAGATVGAEALSGVSMWLQTGFWHLWGIH